MLELAIIRSAAREETSRWGKRPFITFACGVNERENARIIELETFARVAKYAEIVSIGIDDRAYAMVIEEGDVYGAEGCSRGDRDAATMHEVTLGCRFLHLKPVAADLQHAFEVL